ncbi:hypothetical protein G4B85_14595 [Vibrio lentus]|uniref:hypothetical protein n=1 Tax=Vibrio lentus TaxID=136468 RepID=UPI001D05B13D|nr:hypothetical protein [Vibrio lentus]MCB5450229.1 hypothetical protein [Vibrio lentus]
MSRKNHSKRVLLEDDFYEQPAATVEPLKLSELKLVYGGGVTAHMEQLLYKGVPNFSQTGGKVAGFDYHPVEGRERFAREIYQQLKADYNRTKYGHFSNLKLYIRWLDDTHRAPIEDDYFHPDLCSAYMDYHQNKCNRGEQKLTTWTNAKAMLSFFLREHGRTLEAKALKTIKGVKAATESHKGIDIDGEFKPLVRRLIAAFGQFRKHFIEGTRPDIHPIWHMELFEQTANKFEWSARKRGASLAKLKLAVRDYNSTRNHFCSLAAILVFCFTGQNTNPILNLRFGDIRFSDKPNGKVFFDMTKNRAEYLGFDTSLGFHKKAAEFIHQWLDISKSLQKQSGTDWVFPYLMESGEIKSYTEAGQKPQPRLNRLSSILGLAHVTPSILRQTKIDTLMKVTQDIYLVALSANNEVETIKVSYGHGSESDHKKNIAANNEALYDTVKNGTNVDEAVTNAKFDCADVLTDYNYKRLRKEEREKDTQTPLGVRCKDSTKGAANTVKKNLEKMGFKQPEGKLCTDFLACFDCPHHRLVSEVEDIWLMLSFNDTLQQMKEYPAINSLPTDKFHKLCNTIESILMRFKEVAPDNYAEAKDLHSEAPHELYSDGHSLNDLMEAFS